jgi:integrase/recombinase XerD
MPNWPQSPPIILGRSLISCGWQWLPTWPDSRASPASTPNQTCAATSPGAPSTAWTRWPHDDRNWSSISGGCKRSAGSSPPPCPGGSPSRPGSTGPASSTASWSTHPPSTSAAPQSQLNHRPWGSPTCSSRPCAPPPASHRTPCDFARVAMLGLRIFEATGTDVADLGEEHGHRVLRVCGKGSKVVLVPLPPTVGRAIDRAIGARSSGPILLNSRGPDGPARGHPAPATTRRNRRHPDNQGVPAHAASHVRHDHARCRCGPARRPPGRARQNLDRHPNYILAAYMASGT